MQGNAAPVHARTVPQENAPIQAAITNMYTLTWASAKQLKKTYEMPVFMVFVPTPREVLHMIMTYAMKSYLQMLP